MTALMKSFGFGEQLVRVVERDDEYWFVANDVCAALEIVNPRNAVARLDEDERDCVHTMDAIGRDRETTIVSESGVYALIFTSRKPVAKQFRKWVTGEVLPTLRRTGHYEIVASNDDDDDARPAPAMPDDDDRDRLSLQMVREARIAFGTAAARKMWALRQLPDLAPQPERLTLPAMISAETNRSISEWMEARCDFKPGARAGSTGLYGDYVRWCRLEGGHEPLSQVSFGRFLTACGILIVKSNITYRSGIALRKAEPVADAADG